MSEDLDEPSIHRLEGSFNQVGGLFIKKTKAHDKGSDFKLPKVPQKSILG